MNCKEVEPGLFVSHLGVYQHIWVHKEGTEKDRRGMHIIPVNCFPWMEEILLAYIFSDSKLSDWNDHLPNT